MQNSRKVDQAMACMNSATCDVLRKSEAAHYASQSAQFEARELRVAAHKRRISDTIAFDPNELKPKEPT